MLEVDKVDTFDFNGEILHDGKNAVYWLVVTSFLFSSGENMFVGLIFRGLFTTFSSFVP